ncbi:MAG: aldo/keto reductase, partial [Oscillospiraceae bacterium]|nr:aldo/keto reductase [Oscillospiraceae bacterium]
QFPVVAYSSQANGYITKVLSGQELPPKVARSYDYPRNRARAARAGEVARELGCPPEAVGLAYLFARPFPVCAIIWPRNTEQLLATLASADIELTAAQKAYLEKDE